MPEKNNKKRKLKKKSMHKEDLRLCKSILDLSSAILKNDTATKIVVVGAVAITVMKLINRKR